MTLAGIELRVAELYALMNGFCIFLHMIVFARSFRDMNGLRRAGTYRAAVISSAIMCFSDTLFFLCNYLKGIHFMPPLLMTLKTIYFLSNEVMCVCWFFYFEAQQHPIHNRHALISCLPLFIVFILLVLNFQNGMLFRVNKETVYERGKFFSLLYIFSYCYIIYFSIAAFIRSLKDDNYGNRDVLRTIALFPVLPAICGIIQFFDPALPVLCGGMSCIILIHYMTQLRILISKDPLTGLNNRRYFLNQFSQEIKKHKDDDTLALIMIDIDQFKQINDRFGHDEGDHALCLTADALRKTAAQSKKYCLVARYGGDEFMMLTKGKSQKEVFQIESLLEKNINALQDRHRLYQISLSFGHAFYHSGMSVKTLLQKSDSAMYSSKEEHHKKKQN